MTKSSEKAQIVYLPVKKIFPHPRNPRRELGDLTDLVGSIKVKGILQNLTVVPRVENGTTVADEWHAVIGHRRHAAAIQAGLEEVPCVISDMSPKEQFETMMIENVQRNALTAYEQAKGFQMMLNMGDSVEQVAKKTGFSESTIRRRAQLASLDEERFRKTENRGASMEDYLKLSKIKDPSKRNSVLEKIGTAEFHNAYQTAITDEKNQAYMTSLINGLRKCEWLKEVTSANLSEYNYYTTCGTGERKIPTEPKGAKPGEYVFVVYSHGVTLYRKKSSPARKTEEEKLHGKFEEDVTAITKQLQAINKRFYQMRFDFVNEFTSFSTYEMDVAAFAARAMADCDNGYIHTEGLSKLLGVEAYTPPGVYTKRLKQEDWKKVLFHQPQRALLCTAWAKLDTQDKGYMITSYNYKLQISEPQHKKDPRLDLVYEGLKSLGYEMCEEEIQMQNGTHPLFAQAKAQLKIYKEEVALLQERAKRDLQAKSEGK